MDRLRRITLTSSSVTKWKPVADGSVFTPAVDQRYGRLGVRYSLSDGMHINVYSLAAARAGDYSTVLASFKQPALTPGIDFQGWTLYGSYAYFWEGDDGSTRTITYGELFQEVNRLSAAMKKLGVKKGDRIAIYMPAIPG